MFALLIPGAAWIPRVRMTVPTATRAEAERQPGPVVRVFSTMPDRSSVGADNRWFRPTISVPPEATNRQPDLPASRTAFDPWVVGLWLWMVGASVALMRLMRMDGRLTRLLRSTTPADASVQSLANTLAFESGVRGVDVRQSATTRFPFASGWPRPLIVVPESIEKKLSEPQLRAVLAHEVCHVGGRDVAWNIGWSVVQAVLWFHPLAWGAARAHRFACEELADRGAMEHCDPPHAYPQLISSTVLCLAGVRGAEPALVMNAGSEIVRRLQRLQCAWPRWNGWKSLTSGCVAAGLLVCAAGWQPVTGHASSRANATAVPAAPKEDGRKKLPAMVEANREMGVVTVRVVDPENRPVSGADIRLDGLRVEGDLASHYSWGVLAAGSSPTTVTDAEGKASLRYPLMTFPQEKQRTAQLSFVVQHPDFVTSRPVEFPVTGKAPPVRMERGATLTLSASAAPGVKPLVAWLATVSGDLPLVWTTNALGQRTTRQIRPGNRLVRVSGRTEEGQLVFWNGMLLEFKAGEEQTIKAQLRPGTRLEGRLDARVPRPVVNGGVVVSVRPPGLRASDDADEFAKLQEAVGWAPAWTASRMIEADGTFVFESLPPGEADLVVLGEGFVSAPGGQARNANGPLSIGVPQRVPLAEPVTRYEVRTESSASLSVLVTDPKGQPVSGVRIGLSPNVLRMQTGLFALGLMSSERALVTSPFIPPPNYMSTTDGTGRARLPNLPGFTAHLDVNHPDFEVPKQPNGHRSLKVVLSPGKTEDLTLKLQPKGKEFLGQR